MNLELQQSVTNAAGQKVNAAIASGATVTAGLSTYLNLLPAVLGSIASVCGIALSATLTYYQIKKGRLERQQLHLQIAVLREKEAERLERAASRIASGSPARRKVDSLDTVP